MIEHIAWSVMLPPSPDSDGAAGVGDRANTLEEAAEQIVSALKAAPTGFKMAAITITPIDLPDDAT